MPRRIMSKITATTATALVLAVVLSSVVLAADTPKERTQPRPTPYRAGDSAAVRFDPSLYLRYREYRAALGLLVAWCVLWLKAVLAF